MSSIARILTVLVFVLLGLPGCGSFPVTGDVNFRSYPKESPQPKPTQPRSDLEDDETTVARNEQRDD